MSSFTALVQAVATANRCRIVCAEKVGFVAVIGADCDLEFVELLSTSLLVQANRAMLAVGRTTTGKPSSATVSRTSSMVKHTRLRADSPPTLARFMSTSITVPPRTMCETSSVSPNLGIMMA